MAVRRTGIRARHNLAKSRKIAISGDSEASVQRLGAPACRFNARILRRYCALTTAHAPRVAGGDFGPIHDNNRHRRRTKGPAGDMAKSGVDYVRNATRTKKFPLGLIFGAFALMGMAPAAHAVENDADAGVVVPDEPDDEAFNPGVAPSVDENRDARAVFQAWKRLDTGLTATRSEEHTSELQSLMRISYAVFCLKKKNKKQRQDK